MSGFLNFFDQPNALPNMQSLQLPTMQQILQQYLSQGSQVGSLNSLAQTLNTDENQGVQQQVSALDPSMMGNLQTLGTNTQSMLNGQIPQDVMDQITRSDAYQSLAGGYGGSGMAHALTARDLGLTSLNLQQQGAGNLGLESGLDTSLTPGRSTAAGMMISPSAIMGADDTQAQYNNGIQNQNQMINYQNSLRTSPFSQVVNNALGSLVSAPFNFVSNYANELSGGQGISAFNGWMTGSPSLAGAATAPSSSSSSGGGGLLGGLLGGGGGAGLGGLLALI